MISNIIILVLIYVIAAIPFGVVFARYFCNKDVLSEGSKSSGATNVARVCGKKWGFLVLIADFLKGFIPTYCLVNAEYSAVFITMAAFVAVIGHSYSCFLHFRGGKSVAITLGIWLALAPLALFFGVLVCLGVIVYSRYVSAGSLSFVLSLPFFLFILHQYAYIPLSLLLLIFIFLRHKENVERMLQGIEAKWQ